MDSQPTFPRTALIGTSWKTPRFEAFKSSEHVDESTTLIRPELFPPEESNTLSDFLAFCRSVTRYRNLGDEAPAKLQPFAYRWIRFLCEESASSYLLQDMLLSGPDGDGVFYDLHQSPHYQLQPKARGDWGGGWDAALPWLEHPERLTVPELEVAVAIFRWDETIHRPRLAAWIRDSPHILPRIQRYALRHYCWWLKTALEEATGQSPDLASRAALGGASLRVRAGRASGVPPYSDLESETPGARNFDAFQAFRPHMRNSRFLAIAFVGFIGLLNVPMITSVFTQSSLWYAIVLALVGLGAIGVFSTAEVYQRNPGFIVSRKHALPRIVHLASRFALYGAVVTLTLFAAFIIGDHLAGPIPMIAGDPLLNLSAGREAEPPLVWPPAHYLFGWLNMAVYSTLFGVLFESIWQNSPATEPL